MQKEKFDMDIIRNVEGETVLDRKILSEYIDACEMIKETEQEIRRLETKRNRITEEVVKGSNPNFPYQPQHFHVSGREFGYGDDRNLRIKEQLLEKRKKQAEIIKIQTEAWMNTIPMRMQRIIKYKIFEGLSWEETAARIGRKATGDSVKKEYQRFMKVCPECPQCPEKKC